MSSGLTKNLIQTELAQSLTGIPQIDAVFGFGSYFRGEPFHDIDLVLVFKEDCENTLAVYELVLSRLKEAYVRLGVRLHITPLTANEFREKPLREHALLIPLLPDKDVRFSNTVD